MLELLYDFSDIPGRFFSVLEWVFLFIIVAENL